MHKNNPFSKTVSNHSLLHTLEEKKNKAKLSKSSLSSALVRFTNGETWVCARGRSHNFYDFFFYSMYLCVCGVLANKSFRLFFICLKHHYSAHYRIENVFRGGLNLATFRIFLRLVFVGMCVCVCVVCLWNRVSCVVCSVFVGVLVWTPSKFLIFPRARNDGLTVLRNLTLTVSHNLLKSRITLSRCARPQPEVSTKFFQQVIRRTVRKNSLETATNTERANRTQLLLLIFLFPSLISQAIFAVGLCSCVSFSRRTRKL